MTNQETKERVYVIDPNEIIVPERRQRRGYDPAELRKLEQSIVKLGQLQPGVCRKEGSDVVLIAGFRRLMACKNLSQNYNFVLKEEIVDPIVREEIELHENLMREELDFKDEAAAHARLHKLYMKTRGQGSIKGQPTWSLQKTAQELSISTATLHSNIEIDHFSKTIPTIKDAKSKTEARKVIKRIKDQAIQTEALRQLQTKATIPATPDVKSLNAAEVIEQRLAAAAQEFTKYTHLGDFQTVLPKICEPETFDVVFFDPPWGVDFSTVFHNSGDRKMYSDEKKDFFLNLSSWLQTLYQYMKPDSHLYLKFGIVHHFWVVRMLMRAGFVTNGIPIIWRKIGSHRTRTPAKWPGRCYEPILLAHKGQKPLQQQGRQDYIETPTPTPTMKGIHPSVIHPTVPRELFQRSCFPGDKILDPMAGSGMTGVAAESLRNELQLSYTLIDKEPEFRTLMIQNLLKGYARITDPTTQDIPVSTNYRDVKPGSAEWLTIWGKHPELRDEMMQWSKNL